MKQLSILLLATTAVFVQTGCFDRTASNNVNSAQFAQAAATTSPGLTSPTIANPANPLPANTVVTASNLGAATPMLESPIPLSSLAALKPAMDSIPVPSLPSQVNLSSFIVHTTDGEPLEMRASGDSQATVLATLPQGTSVLMRVGDPTGTWFEVATVEGQVGWVAGAYLLNPQTGARVSSKVPALEVAAACGELATSIVGTESLVPLDTSQNDALNFDRVVQTLDGEPLNMRAAPHLNADFVSALPHGTFLSALQHIGPWSLVVTEDGVEGFVATDYLVAR